MSDSKKLIIKIFSTLMVFLGIIILVTSTNAFGLLGYDKQTLIDLKNNLDEAAIKYVSEHNPLGECFYNTPPGVESDCAKKVEVKTLIEEDYFTDELEWCDLGTEEEPTYVIVYNHAENINEEKIIKVNKSDDICK